MILWILIGVGLLLFLRFFWVLIRWEVRWDARLLEFGIHAFLLGIILCLGLLFWAHALTWAALSQVFRTV